MNVSRKHFVITDITFKYYLNVKVSVVVNTQFFKSKAACVLPFPSRSCAITSNPTMDAPVSSTRVVEGGPGVILAAVPYLSALQLN